MEEKLCEHFYIQNIVTISRITTALTSSCQENDFPDQNFEFWHSVHSTVNRELRDGSDGRTSLTRINRNPSSALRCLRPTSSFEVTVPLILLRV